jgi:DNA-binding PadR family transcriptional regulator
MVTLAALPAGDTLSFTRLQDLIGLTPGNLITHLRKLEDAGYVQMNKTGSGVNALTAVALTHDGRTALGRYTAVLRQLLDTPGQSNQAEPGTSPAQRRAGLALGRRPFTNHMQKTLSLFEKGPLALVAGAEFEPATRVLTPRRDGCKLAYGVLRRRIPLARAVAAGHPQR